MSPFGPQFSIHIPKILSSLILSFRLTNNSQFNYSNWCQFQNTADYEIDTFSESIIYRDLIRPRLTKNAM